jgi:hypothetical protein
MTFPPKREQKKLERIETKIFSEILFPEKSNRTVLLHLHVDAASVPATGRQNDAPPTPFFGFTHTVQKSKIKNTLMRLQLQQQKLCDPTPQL